MDPEARLQRMGIQLPAPPKAMATYRSAVRSGNLLFVAGQGPMLNGKPTAQGKLGGAVSFEQGYEAARVSALNALAVVRAAVGSLNEVRQFVRATVYVASTPDFTDQPRVANGATDLLRELWGDDGLPARAAVGVPVLPMDIPVELELAVELRP
jgi:enamine deaminase RidA (YjgF/YER057c/UK114 family)